MICITDGTETVTSPEPTLSAAVAAYAASYGFNDPGDVDCVAYAFLDEASADENDWDALVNFTIRSDDGHHGYLVTEG